MAVHSMSSSQVLSRSCGARVSTASVSEAGYYKHILCDYLALCSVCMVYANIA